MRHITFVTGNQNKADKLALHLGHNLSHMALDLEEVQSLDLREVARHKAKQAFKILRSPVLIEDTSLEFTALGRLPGTFIKHFLDEIGTEKLCEIINDSDRSATARSMFAYYDGQTLKTFEGSLEGSIAGSPSGSNGYGWDSIFIPTGMSKTLAALNKKDYERAYTTIKPFKQLKDYLDSIH